MKVLEAIKKSRTARFGKLRRPAPGNDLPGDEVFGVARHEVGGPVNAVHAGLLSKRIGEMMGSVVK
jgi:hypothetical protein